VRAEEGPLNMVAISATGGKKDKFDVTPMEKVNEEAEDLMTMTNTKKTVRTKKTWLGPSSSVLIHVASTSFICRNFLPCLAVRFGRWLKTSEW
jgi:hypothetical protein